MTKLTHLTTRGNSSYYKVLSSIYDEIPKGSIIEARINNNLENVAESFDVIHNEKVPCIKRLTANEKTVNEIVYSVTVKV